MPLIATSTASTRRSSRRRRTSVSRTSVSRTTLPFPLLLGDAIARSIRAAPARVKATRRSRPMRERSRMRPWWGGMGYIQTLRVERFVAEVARLAGEAKTEAVRRALEERRERLALRVGRTDAVLA